LPRHPLPVAVDFRRRRPPRRPPQSQLQGQPIDPPNPAALVHRRLLSADGSTTAIAQRPKRLAKRQTGGSADCETGHQLPADRPHRLAVRPSPTPAPNVCTETADQERPYASLPGRSYSRRRLIQPRRTERQTGGSYDLAALAIATTHRFPWPFHPLRSSADRRLYQTADQPDGGHSGHRLRRRLRRPLRPTDHPRRRRLRRPRLRRLPRTPRPTACGDPRERHLPLLTPPYDPHAGPRGP
jgi:hypothetical protein